MGTFYRWCGLVLVMSSATLARADKVHVGIKGGVVIPQLGSKLKAAVGFEVEGGYRVWKNLAVQLAASYQSPSTQTSATDPRLEGKTYTTDTSQRELMLSLGGLWWFWPATKAFNVYVSLAGRMYLLETITNGKVGTEEFLENRETSTRFGVAGAAGAEYTLGPGRILGELQIAGSDLPHLITGDVATTALAISAGYRLFF